MKEKMSCSIFGNSFQFHCDWLLLPISIGLQIFKKARNWYHMNWIREFNVWEMHLNLFVSVVEVNNVSAYLKYLIKSFPSGEFWSIINM